MKPGNPHTLIEFELHAFVDGELAAAEQQRVVEAASVSAEVRARLESLQRLKDLVCAAYGSDDTAATDDLQRSG